MGFENFAIAGASSFICQKIIEHLTQGTTITATTKLVQLIEPAALIP